MNITERKRLKAVRRRNRIVKSHNFEVKTLKHLPILMPYASEAEKIALEAIRESNKELRRIRINAIQAN